MTQTTTLHCGGMYPKRKNGNCLQAGGKQDVCRSEVVDNVVYSTLSNILRHASAAETNEIKD